MVSVPSHVISFLTERKEPFALVLYTSTGEKGVVKSKDIPKDKRKPGEICNVPNPVDFQGPEDQENIL